MTALTIAESNPNQPTIHWSADQVRVLREELFKDVNDVQFALFAQVCRRTGLDPFAKQIYAIVRGGKLTIQTSIDGYRLTAQRSGQYNGQTPPEWYDGEKWIDVWLNTEFPKAARIGVYLKGNDNPTWGVATWTEYAADTSKSSGAMWKKMPALMLVKCAEALALRKCFPAELSGVYTDTELHQSDVPTAASNTIAGDDRTQVIEAATAAGFTQVQAEKRADRMTSAEVADFIASCEVRAAEIAEERSAETVEETA